MSVTLKGRVTHKPSHLKYLIDGEEYFRQVRDAIANAQNYVLITDWWMSEQAHLDHNDLTLIEFLKFIVDEKKGKNAKFCIYILLWNDAWTNYAHSIYIAILRATHDYRKRIKVKLQALGFNKPISRWSHHQKTVVVDGYVGFVTPAL